VNPPATTWDDGRPRLLLVDDEVDVLEPLAEILEAQGYAVVSTWEGEEAVEIAELFEPSIVVTDFRLPGLDGVSLVHQVRESHPETRAILVSGYLSPDTRERARAEHVDAVLEKPLSVPRLLAELREVATR
jgi:two-component system, NtrC family, nitrogen regulation response regulator NtrX